MSLEKANSLRLVIFLILLLKSTGYKLKKGIKFQTNSYVTKCSPQINSNSNCDLNSKFRTFNGSCNNLKTPWLGQSFTPYKRYFDPAYENNFDKPKQTNLPNPRSVSRVLFNDNSFTDLRATHLVTFFGQFISHDLTHAPITTRNKNGKFLTCNCDLNDDEDCLTIKMPQNEQIMKISCMKLSRTKASFPQFNCSLDYREQINQMSSYLDGTQIYGVDERRANVLRSFRNGLLNSNQGINEHSYLPQTDDSNCAQQTEDKKCFAAGELRTNQNLALVSVHTLFMREHNRIASELASLNPNWSDDRIYHEARRINLAIYQHITYNEYLPIILGDTIVKKFSLTPLSNGYTRDYSQSINPTISNEFAAGAFRFGHTLVRNRLGRYNQYNRQINLGVNLSDIIFRPVEAYNKPAGGLDSIFLSLINEPCAAFDTHIADTLQNHLFENKISDTLVLAEDLAAVNILRGRDHGLPSYTRIKELCGFPKSNTFQDLNDFIEQDKIDKLKMIYENVNDIDFYVGGLSERPNADALLGPTFSCIIINQFKDLKKGDRFFYEHGPFRTSFTENQLNEIRKTSMSSLICNNFDLDAIQPNAFQLPLDSLKNRRTSCDNIVKMTLKDWKE